MWIQASGLVLVILSTSALIKSLDNCSLRSSFKALILWTKTRTTTTTICAAGTAVAASTSVTIQTQTHDIWIIVANTIKYFCPRPVSGELLQVTDWNTFSCRKRCLFVVLHLLASLCQKPHRHDELLIFKMCFFSLKAILCCINTELNHR